MLKNIRFVLGLSLLASLLLVTAVGAADSEPRLEPIDADIAATIDDDGRKQIAAAPEEMDQMRLPEPAAVGQTAHSAMMPVSFATGRDGSNQWATVLPVADGENVSVALLSPNAADWSVSVTTAAGERTALTRDGGENYTYQQEMVGMGNVQIPAQVYQFESIAAGQLWVVIRNDATAMTDLDAKAAQSGPAGYVVISENSPQRLYTHLTTHNLVVGNEAGLAARLFDKDSGMTNENVLRAVLHLERPTGETQMVAMVDDGRHGDGAANDGVYGALFDLAAAGEYEARVEMMGRTDSGRMFLRTGQHVFPAVDARFSAVDGLVETRATADRLYMTLGLQTVRNAADSTADVNVSADVWADGKAVAWVGGLATPYAISNGLMGVNLSVDGGWLARAGVNSATTIELRNVRVQDAVTHIPLLADETAAARVTDLPANALGRAPQQITDAMLMGNRPAVDKTSSTTRAAGSKLVLSHGYCSESVWPVSHFTNAAEFRDLNQNRTHDEFARLLRDFGSQFDSFGLVAHSQGGAASLHLYTYYWSGLDNSSGARLIQSVGTPYQGTALAGNLAALGDIFGVGCGTNWDLTYDGASLWLSNIPSWARSRVHYATTSFNDRWWAYDYCNIGSDLFLDDPDDGVIEKWSGQLSGANNMGHKTGWCHTRDMRDPGQTTDYSRNSNMNANANR